MTTVGAHDEAELLDLNRSPYRAETNRLMLLSQISARYADLNEQTGFRRKFLLWKDAKSELEQFDDPSDLISYFRDKSKGYELKNPIALLLAQLAQRGDEAAQLLLFEIYMPMLFGLRRRYRGYGLTEEEIDEHLVLGFLESVSSLHPSVSKASGYLRYGTKSAVSNAVKDRIEERRIEVAPAGLRLEETEPRAVEDVEGTVEALTNNRSIFQVLDQAEERNIVTNFEARIIEATRMEENKIPIEEIAQWLGIKPETLLSRRWRGEGRLARWLKGEPVPPRRKISSRV